MTSLRQRPLRGVLVAVAVVAALGFALVSPAAAQVETAARSVQMPDPTSITFSLRVTSSGGLRSAEVNYRVLNPDGGVRGSARAEVTATTTQDLRATLQTNSAQRYIPVGSRFAYSWTLVDADGQTHTTSEESFTFLDGRQQWQTLEAELLTVYWYGSNASDAQSVFDGVLEAIAMNEELLQVELAYPIRVVLYRNSADASTALRSRGGVYDEQTITGGARVALDLIHVYHPLQSYAEVARHEAGHVLAALAGDGPFSSIPSWLDEGVAVSSQDDPGSGYRGGVERAIVSDTTLRLRSLANPVNDASLVNQFYGQSWSTVQYMLDTYGREAFAQLFAALKAGAGTDAALMEVYGINQDQLYNDWRVSVGLEAIDFSLMPDATLPPLAEGTRPPLGIPTSAAGGASAPTPASGSTTTPAASEGNSNATTAIVIGVVSLLLAAALGGLGFRMLRSKQS